MEEEFVPKVLVMGANGMLGSQVVEIMKHKEIEVYSTKKNIQEPTDFQYRFGIDNLEHIISKIPNLEYVINCIGAIPQRNASSESFRINAKLPRKLQDLSNDFNFKVIQIATDCAFDGLKGRYSENDVTDAIDAYGASKILGEIKSLNFMHIRCSIIGNDRESRSLYSWLLSHKEDSVVTGYTNHFWNGVTTLAFANVVSGIVLSSSFKPGIHHLVPSSSVTKYELLEIIRNFELRTDLLIIPHETNTKVDRTLTTIDMRFNQEMWKYGGYRSVPTVKNLVNEFAFLNSEKRRK